MGLEYYHGMVFQLDCDSNFPECFYYSHHLGAHQADQTGKSAGSNALILPKEICQVRSARRIRADKGHRIIAGGFEVEATVL